MKRVISILLAVTMAVSGAFALDLNDINELKGAVDRYAENKISALPVEVAVNNMWADACIGGTEDNPLHFAVGGTFGIASIKDSQLSEDLAALTGISSLPKLKELPFPVVSLNGRVTGFNLPFDIGFRGFAGKFKLNNTMKRSVTIDRFGVDIRYGIMKQDVFLPSISVGFGYDHVDDEIDLTCANAEDAGVRLAIKTDMLSGTAEASWQFLNVKLFTGVSVYKPIGNGSMVSGSVYNGSGSAAVECLDSRMSWNIFGGTSASMGAANTTVGLTYDVTNGKFGASLSTRVQF